MSADDIILAVSAIGVVLLIVGMALFLLFGDDE